MENLVNPYPARIEANLRLDGALAEVNSHGKDGDMMPVDRSVLQQTLVLGIKWSHGTHQEQILARVAIPIMAAASAALDSLLHATNAVVKTISIIPNVAVWAIRSPSPEGRLSIEFGEALQHLAKAIGSVGLIAIAPIVASYDPEKALEISDKLMITAGVTFLAEKMKIGPATLFEGWRLAQGAVRKVAFAVSEVTLNIGWRPWRWMVTASVEQVRAHPYVVIASIVAASYLGCSKAGYTGYVDGLFASVQVNAGNALGSVTTTVSDWIDQAKQMIGYPPAEPGENTNTESNDVYMQTENNQNSLKGTENTNINQQQPSS